VLAESNADYLRPPASMVKLLQLLLVAEGLKGGTWTLETPISVSEHAQHMGGTQVYLKAGEVHRLAELIPAVAVASANDAAMAVAEGLWGSEQAFLARMNARARELGMTNSEFSSVHGLPPDKGEQPDRTTARNMAALARACVREPVILEWVNQKEFQLRPDQAIHYNTNKLLWRFEGCDGLKTGYTRAAGFCAAVTAQREDLRLIAVVMGFPSNSGRFKLADQLLEDGFARLCRVRVATRGEAVEPPIAVDNCETRFVRLAVIRDLWVNVKAEDVARLKVAATMPPRLQAPVRAGTIVGEIQAELDGRKLAGVPLTVPDDLAETSWRWKLKNRVFRKAK
jgi:D-alanyl-D-alanine carboxypeptidase (penicillin-binding protein 5/6)